VRRWSLVARTRFLLIAGWFAVLVAIGVAGYGAWAARDGYQRADAARQLELSNKDFVIGMINQETGIRGYINTGQSEFLQPYVLGRQQVVDAIGLLHKDPKLATPVSQATAAATQWQLWAEERKAVVDSTGHSAIDVLQSKEGKARFDAFRAADDQLASAEGAQVSQAIADAKMGQGLGFSLLLLAGLLAAAVLAWMGVILIRRTLRPVAQLAATARDLALGKGARVSPSTRDDEIGDLSRALGAWQSSVGDREQLFTMSLDMLAIAGFDGVFKVVNPAWEKTTGLSVAELTSKPYIEFVHPDDRPATIAEGGKLAQGATTVSFRNRYLCKDGSYKWLEWTAAPVAEQSLIYAVARDITEQQAAEDALRRSGAQIRAILDNVADGIVTLDEHGVIESANPNVYALFGYGPSDVAGQNVKLLIADPDRADFLTHLNSYLRPGKKQIRSGSHETVGRRKDGSTFPLEFIGSQMEFGAQRMFIGTLRDVTERRTEREGLERQLLYDKLTALPNRTLFLDRLRQSLVEAQRDGTSRSLLIMDMDRFKEVNDTLGHERGDQLLQLVAGRLSFILGGAHTLARLGGDEFALVSTSALDRTGAVQLAQKIRESLEPPFALDGQSVDVRGSIGIAVFPEHGTDVATLMRHADVAMYVAKRNQLGHKLYAEGEDESSASQLGLRGAIRFAIEHDELRLHYQPIVAARTGELEGVEALIRWEHPKRGMIPPVEFIPALESTELINPLTHWVIGTAVRQMEAWRKDGLELSMSVNLSALNLQDEALVAFTCEALDRARIAPERLTMEITETTIMAAGSDDTLAELNRAGIRLSIDDFGTGYSSLSYLGRLPVKIIKIDRSFVMGMTNTAGSTAIVRSIIELSHSLGLKVVAEGVENAEALGLLAQYGCDFVQGYFVSKPVPAPKLVEWLRSRGPWEMRAAA
jgi:diguanylate cyclase (GGDEF)-like protein/PAS domain S-box-containing protein